MLGKHASRQRDRGFESHPLRHSNSNSCRLMCVETKAIAVETTKRGWDSNRGYEGDVSPSWGAYEGAGPLSRTASNPASATSNAPPLRHTALRVTRPLIIAVS